MQRLMLLCIHLQPWTLPAVSLEQAERIVRSRKVNLSVVVGEALAAGLRQQHAAERGGEVLERYRRAFAGFSDEELAVLGRRHSRSGRLAVGQAVIDPASGPFLFDTNAESWLARALQPEIAGDL